MSASCDWKTTYFVISLPRIARRLFWRHQHQQVHPQLSSRRELVSRGLGRELQVVPLDDRFLRWPILPPKPRPTGTYVQHQHAMGYDGQGKDGLQLLPRNAQDLQVLQIYICHSNSSNRRYDLPRRLCPARLGDQPSHRGSTFGGDDCRPRSAATVAEPFTDDFQLLINHVLIVSRLHLYTLVLSAELWRQRGELFQIP